MTETEINETTALAVNPSTGEVVTYDYGKYAGVGKEDTRQDEMQIPFFTLLQGLSPEVQPGDAKYIDGARPGMLCNTLTAQLWAGDEGVLFLPIMRDPCYVEWRPNRQGFVARHDRDSDVVKLAKKMADNDELKLRVRHEVTDPETGERSTMVNDLVRTVYLYGAILEETEGGQLQPVSFVVIAFAITKLKAYRKWYTAINENKQTAAAPLFANLVRITAVPDQNRKGERFFSFVLRPANGSVKASLIASDDPILDECFAFLQKIRSGEVKADLANEGKDDDTAGDGLPIDEAFA